MIEFNEINKKSQLKIIIVLYMIFYIVLILFMIFFLFIVRNKIQKEENYKNVSNTSNESKCIFLTKEQTSKILELVQNSYQDTFSNEDLIARNINKNINQTNYYQNNILDFNDEDKESLNWLVTNIVNRLYKQYRKPLVNQKIGKLSNKLESGFPHTHEDAIFFSENFCKQLNNYKRNNNINDALKSQGLTFIHECIHVWQRKETNKFEDLYKNYWNFEHVPIINNEEIMGKVRKNPDGTDYNWVFCKNGKNIWPVALYNNTNPKNLGDVKYMGIYLDQLNSQDSQDSQDTSKQFKYSHNNKRKELRDISLFIDFFNIYENNYHPNEISAELLSNYYMFLMKMKTMELTDPGIQGLILWLNK